MNQETKSFRQFSSFLVIVSYVLAACGTKVDSALPTTSVPTSPPTPTPTLPSPLLTSTSEQMCVIISPEVQTAYRAWMNLGKPPRLIFHNDAGPDGNGDEKPVTRDTLPDLVHVGDSFCLSGQ